MCTHVCMYLCTFICVCFVYIHAYVYVSVWAHPYPLLLSEVGAEDTRRSEQWRIVLEFLHTCNSLTPTINLVKVLRASKKAWHCRKAQYIEFIPPLSKALLLSFICYFLKLIPKGSSKLDVVFFPRSGSDLALDHQGKLKTKRNNFLIFPNAFE